MRINDRLTARKLLPQVERLFELSAQKILSLDKVWDSSKGAPVFTIKGKYTSRDWTEWTQGFQFGSALLQFDATGDARFLEIGRKNTIQRMAPHVSHMGVHDHGFNNISTYGNLWRLMREGKIPFDQREMDFYEMALKVSGAVQAARWTSIADGKGYIYSFNGPHSLFVDTVRSLRSLAVAHQLGHVLMGERDQRIALLRRLIEHAETTAREHLQPQRRQLSLSQLAARLFALQHVDARPGLGDSRFRRATGIPTDPVRRRAGFIDPVRPSRHCSSSSS
jgi:hypothetical protein